MKLSNEKHFSTPYIFLEKDNPSILFRSSFQATLDLLQWMPCLVDVDTDTNPAKVARNEKRIKLQNIFWFSLFLFQKYDKF